MRCHLPRCGGIINNFFLLLCTFWFFFIVSKYHQKTCQFRLTEERQNHIAKLKGTAAPGDKLPDAHTGATSTGMRKRHPAPSPPPHDPAIGERILSQDLRPNPSTFSSADGEQEWQSPTSQATRSRGQADPPPKQTSAAFLYLGAVPRWPHIIKGLYSKSITNIKPITAIVDLPLLVNM